VRQLVIGGETLSVAHVRRGMEALKQTQIINGYGPTESTTFACTYKVGKELDERVTSIPIGRPISNTQVYVLGDRLEAVPVGVAGEVYIGGDGLARGYLKRAELTAERFVPNPHSEEAGARLYKTGDVGRYLKDGEIEYLGRKDNQVKLRGYRVELEEVEYALREQKGVKDAVVVMREEEVGEKRLVAYVVMEEGAEVSVSRMRAQMKERLPVYMVPSAYAVIEKLPLGPNGKIDRRALPEPDRARREQESTFVAPHNAVEEAIASIFSEVLGVSPVGADDNFFELGGHSLLATQVVSRVRKMFQVDLPLRKFFESPTVAAFAQLLIADEPEHGQAERIATLMKKIESLSTDEVENLLSKKQKGAE